MLTRLKDNGLENQGTEFRASGTVIKFPGFTALYTESRDDIEEEEGGLLPALFGTVTLIVLMALCSFPLGVLAGSVTATGFSSPCGSCTLFLPARSAANNTTKTAISSVRKSA